MFVVSSALEAKTGLGVAPLWTELRDGRPSDQAGISIQKGRRRDVGKLLHKNGQSCQKEMGKDEVTILVGSDRRKPFESYGMGL